MIVTSPVTHTADADVNNASKNSIGFWLLTGSHKRTAPVTITSKNPVTRIFICYSLL